jgi:hypothetical protein
VNSKEMQAQDDGYRRALADAAAGITKPEEWYGVETAPTEMVPAYATFEERHQSSS